MSEPSISAVRAAKRIHKSHMDIEGYALVIDEETEVPLLLSLLDEASQLLMDKGQPPSDAERNWRDRLRSTLENHREHFPDPSITLP